MPSAAARTRDRVLALNLGNTSLLVGLFDGGRLVRHFKVPARDAATASGFTGLVLPGLRPDSARGAVGRSPGPKRLRSRGNRLAGTEKGADGAGRAGVDRIVLCSVVPARTAALARRLERAFGIAPFLLTADAPHGLRIGYRRPRELGTDRLAAAVGAHAMYPKNNVIVVDCGTAATLTAVTADGLLAGGAILPGLALWAEALATRTAQLPHVVARRPRRALGRSPAEAIASGLFHGHLGALRALIAAIAAEAFGKKAFVVIGTGGGAPLFRGESLFDRLEPDLVLRGLHAFAGQID